MDKKIGDKSVVQVGGRGEASEAVQTTQDDCVKPVAYGWAAMEQLEVFRRTYRSVFRKEVAILVEARAPKGRTYIRVIAGREDSDTNSPIGVARQFFYEDIPLIIEGLIHVYKECADTYIGFEKDRIRRSVERDRDSVQDVVAHNRADWTEKLKEIQEDVLSTIKNNT